MPSLQIRELPPEVYESLSHRAERDGRSLAQQAIVDLRKVPELEARQRRMEMIDNLRQSLSSSRSEEPSLEGAPSPESLIRQDRDR